MVHGVAVVVFDWDWSRARNLLTTVLLVWSRFASAMLKSSRVFPHRLSQELQFVHSLRGVFVHSQLRSEQVEVAQHMQQAFSRAGCCRLRAFLLTSVGSWLWSSLGGGLFLAGLRLFTAKKEPGSIIEYAAVFSLSLMLSDVDDL